MSECPKCAQLQATICTLQDDKRMILEEYKKLEDEVEEQRANICTLTKERDAHECGDTCEALLAALLEVMKSKTWLHAYTIAREAREKVGA
jgi:hypothetical protein